MLETGERSMVSEAEFAWIERQVEGDDQHLSGRHVFAVAAVPRVARHRGLEREAG
jgi:hypothetical protein